MADNFNYTHLGCNFCTNRGGFIRRFDLENGAEFAHTDCFNREFEKRAIKSMEAERWRKRHLPAAR